MRVKITDYSPVTGKGHYQGADGKPVAFRYTAFRDLRQIPEGRPAELVDGVLHPVETLRDKIRAFFRRLATWRLRRRT